MPGCNPFNGKDLKSDCITPRSIHPAASRRSWALETFAEYFGGYPVTLAQHYYCDENIYWGDQRVSGVYRLLYSALTRGQNRNRFHGHIPGHPEFWGDLCRQHIRYVRNFTFAETNTLRACPYMPYHDPDRPYVNYWYASAEGATVEPFVDRIGEANLDRLEADGGACIMYTHFGLGFWDGRGSIRGSPSR